MLAEVVAVIKVVQRQHCQQTHFELAAVEAVTTCCQVSSHPLCSLPQKTLTRQRWQDHAEAAVHQPAPQAPAVLLGH